MARLTSCKYCGRVHSTNFKCPETPRYSLKTRTDIDKLRSSKRWRLKREEIKRRDKDLCQCCMRGFPGTLYKFNCNELSVHHIIPLETDIDLAFNDDNLITLCNFHHNQAEKRLIDFKDLQKIAVEQNYSNYI